MNQEGQKFLELLGSITPDLPFSINILNQVISQSKDDNLAVLDELSDVIAKDQGITAKVLSVANSAFYGLRSEVSSVPRALAILGTRGLKALIVGLLSKSLLEGKRPPVEFCVRTYWTHQVRVAVAAEELADLIDLEGKEQLYTAALMHDIGKAIVAIHSPQNWLAIEDLRKQENISAYAAEEQYWGVDHATIGSIALDNWNMPESLSLPINWHHGPDLTPTMKKESLLLYLSDCLVNTAYEGSIPCLDWPEELAELLDVSAKEAQKNAKNILETVAQSHSEDFAACLF